MIRPFKLIAVAALLAAASIAPAMAAVRVCKPAVSGGLKQAASEIGARKLALDAWKAEAAEHGEGFTAWRLASDRFLQCLAVKSGGFECLARASPCKIEQVAPSAKKPRRAI